MRTKERLRNNAAIKNMQQFRHVIRICMQNEWLEKDPFANYVLRLDDTDRGYLTLADVTMIQNVALPSKRHGQTKMVR